ncbi:50S ribosomal protein L4 [Tepidiforma sp.]|jgi:large subunit ribosomal protein L4|uniref:50S ribosomal protein L4 n=1 Tax=Tepidiforma sp. TaxID=2682230 RepID=UPI0026070248|nr:50S ribosomal protein L4 [Tepidiforma sp.]MCX7618712.1 50S ribosomal protein L4 [Tepidiforma sp.]
MKLPVFDTAGNRIREIDAADEVFAIEPNGAVLHQAYVAQMANRRAGLANTKRRGEVAGSTIKIRRQKGLGRSRQGSIRAPHHVGGGSAHGPKPHSFAKQLPRTMKRLALRSALSNHARNGSLLVVDGLAAPDGKTRTVQAILDALKVDRRAIVISGEHDAALSRAARNIDNVKALPAQNLNVVDLVNAHHLVMSEDAVRRCEALWGGANVKPQRGRTREAV